MKKASIVWMIIAAFLILIGGMIFAGGMTMFEWDFSKLGTDKYETNTYEITEDFNDFLIDTNTAEIEFILSENENCKVVCYEETKAKHSVSVENNVLSINVVQTKKWYDYIGFYFKMPRITISIPPKQYGTLNIRCSTGNIQIPEGFSFESAQQGSLTVETDTGNIIITIKESA